MHCSNQEEEEEGEEQVDSGTMVKVGDGNDNTMIVNTATSVQSQDTMIVNSEPGTLLESDLGTMVINSDDDEDATMKSELLFLGLRAHEYALPLVPTPCMHTLEIASYITVALAMQALIGDKKCRDTRINDSSHSLSFGNVIETSQ